MSLGSCSFSLALAFAFGGGVTYSATVVALSLEATLPLAFGASFVAEGSQGWRFTLSFALAFSFFLTVP